MKTRYFLLIILIVLISLGIFIYYNIETTKPLTPSCPNYVLNEGTRDTSNEIEYLNNLTSIDNISVTKIVLEEIIEPGVMDGGYSLYAYYSEAENKFWITECRGFCSLNLYGPFEGYPCLK